MSSVTPHRSDNDGPQPRLVIELAHDACVSRLAYLPDGQRVVSSDKGTVRVWNLEDGKQEGTSTLWEENTIFFIANLAER